MKERWKKKYKFFKCPYCGDEVYREYREGTDTDSKSRPKLYEISKGWLGGEISYEHSCNLNLR